MVLDHDISKPFDPVIVLNIEPHIPLSYKEAISGEDVQFWIPALDDEQKSIKENNTWELVKLPPGRKVIK